jgi:hypothetical protein
MLKNKECIINFGKHKGKSVSECLIKDPEYLYWLMKNTDKTDFSDDLKKEIKSAEDKAYRARYDGMSWGDLEF